MLRINDFNPFVPSNDYEISKAFYEHIGFKINWDSGGFALPTLSRPRQPTL